MKALITGSEGQLGAELMGCVPVGCEARGVDIAELDLTDAAAVSAHVAGFAPDVIVNAAAYTAVDKAEDEPEAAYAANRDAVANLALAAKAVGARLLHVSTDYVFDGRGHVPYRPDDPTGPLGVYGASKLAGEQALREILPDRSVIVRTAWLYSVRGNNFVKTMLRLMATRDSLGVVADQIGTPTAAATLADVLWRFAAKPKLSGVYHWTDAGVASWYDFAVAIREEGVAAGLLGEKAAAVSPIATADYPTKAARPAYSVLDKAATWRALELVPAHWREPLRSTLKGLIKAS